MSSSLDMDRVNEILREISDNLYDYQKSRCRLALTGILNKEQIKKEETIYELFHLVQQKLDFRDSIALFCQILERINWSKHTDVLKQNASPSYNMVHDHPEVNLRLTVVGYYDNMRDDDYRNSRLMTAKRHLDMAVDGKDRVEFVQILCERDVIKIGDISKIEDHRYPHYFDTYKNQYQREYTTEPRRDDTDEFVSLPQYLPIISNPGVTPDVSFTRQFLFSSSDVSKLMIILHPIKERLHQLGHHLNIDKFTLEELSRMDDSTTVEKLEFLLQKWCEQDGTLSNLKEALVQIDREDLVPRLYDIMYTSSFVQELLDIDTPMSFEEPIFSDINNRDEYDLVCSGLCLSLRKRRFVAREVRHDSLIIALNGQRRELMEYKRKLQSVTDKLNGKDQEYKEQEQKLEALLKEKDDLENELRQTQNTEHIQHLNSVLRNKNEIIASLTDKIDMYREMRNSKIAEIEFWRNKYDTANTEKHEEEKEIQKLIVEKKELETVYLELKKEFNDKVLELNKKYKNLEESHTEMLSEFKNTQTNLHMKEREIKKKDEELAQIQQGEETCNCGQKTLSSQEIQDCLMKEFDSSSRDYARELNRSPGYQILHDVLMTMDWKQAQTTKKYCNFKIISQDGFPAKVALYTQWPYKIIECTIQGEEACCTKIITEIIPKAIHQVLTKKALLVQLKFLCAHPDCSQDEKHYATPDKSGNMQLVCDRKNKSYVCSDESQQKVLEACQQLMGVVSCGLSTQVSYTSEYKYQEIVIRDELQKHEQENLFERVRTNVNRVDVRLSFESCSRHLTTQQAECDPDIDDLSSLPSGLNERTLRS